MEIFTFNQHNVCLNPNQYVVLPRPNWAEHYITIITYFQNEKWHSGIRVNFNNFGKSSSSNTGYDSEKEAYSAQRPKIIDYIQKSVLSIAEKKLTENLTDKFNHFPDSKQLSLF